MSMEYMKRDRCAGVAQVSLFFLMYFFYLRPCVCVCVCVCVCLRVYVWGCVWKPKTPSL